MGGEHLKRKSGVVYRNIAHVKTGCEGAHGFYNALLIKKKNNPSNTNTTKKKKKKPTEILRRRLSVPRESIKSTTGGG